MDCVAGQEAEKNDDDFENFDNQEHNAAARLVMVILAPENIEKVWETRSGNLPVYFFDVLPFISKIISILTLEMYVQ